MNTRGSGLLPRCFGLIYAMCGFSLLGCGSKCIERRDADATAFEFEPSEQAAHFQELYTGGSFHAVLIGISGGDYAVDADENSSLPITRLDVFATQADGTSLPCDELPCDIRIERMSFTVGPFSYRDAEGELHLVEQFEAVFPEPFVHEFGGRDPYPSAVVRAVLDGERIHVENVDDEMSFQQRLELSYYQDIEEIRIDFVFYVIVPDGSEPGHSDVGQACTGSMWSLFGSATPVLL